MFWTYHNYLKYLTPYPVILMLTTVKPACLEFTFNRRVKICWQDEKQSILRSIFYQPFSLGLHCALRVKCLTILVIMVFFLYRTIWQLFAAKVLWSVNYSLLNIQTIDCVVKNDWQREMKITLSSSLDENVESSKKTNANKLPLNLHISTWDQWMV